MAGAVLAVGPIFVILRGARASGRLNFDLTLASSPSEADSASESEFAYCDRPARAPLIVQDRHMTQQGMYVCLLSYLQQGPSVRKLSDCAGIGSSPNSKGENESSQSVVNFWTTLLPDRSFPSPRAFCAFEAKTAKIPTLNKILAVKNTEFFCL